MGYLISQDFGDVWIATKSGQPCRIVLVSFGPAFIFVIFGEDGMNSEEEMRIGREALLDVLSFEDRIALTEAGVNWRTLQPSSRLIFSTDDWVSDYREVFETWRALKLPPPWFSRKKLMDQAIRKYSVPSGD